MVEQRLVDAGLTVAAKVPSVGATIQIADIKGVEKARSYVRLLDRVADWLPLVALAVGRTLYLDELPGSYLSQDSAGHLFDLLVATYISVFGLSCLRQRSSRWSGGYVDRAGALRRWISFRGNSRSASAVSRFATAIGANRGLVSIVVIAVTWSCGRTLRRR